ncbi:MAG TPA: histidinol-phosphatase HisJ family protein [Candidatus Pullilachnospira stercoravium]|uniref:Histidinol-phosphatase n=1 Tax=Candidatus Pullilachnospira stercoravium TaxID=2840913 RepID=A0A9D1NWD8_9FIRM|nr:histidinol-phosphatase HisJ family protein [Candidatus Pullilachnospira stercoravium]
MLADCHLHTEFSTDSETPMRAQAERALELGIPAICVTDHMDMDYPQGEFWLDTDRYMEAVRRLQEEYRGRLEIGFGVELGLMEHLRARQEEYLKKYPFDFVIGSVHLIHGEDPYNGELFRKYGDEEVFREYFRLSHRLLADAPSIQSWGHLDYVVRYGQNPEVYSYRKYADEIDAVLKLLLEKGIALEVNTAGFRTLGRTNPEPDVLRRYRELGGELITVGSDGHQPEYLGYRFRETEELLRSCGFSYYAVFRQRKPEFIKI